jgi:hypothetical protein
VTALWRSPRERQKNQLERKTLKAHALAHISRSARETEPRSREAPAPARAEMAAEMAHAAARGTTEMAVSQRSPGAFPTVVPRLALPPPLAPAPTPAAPGEDAITSVTRLRATRPSIGTRAPVRPSRKRRVRPARELDGARPRTFAVAIILLAVLCWSAAYGRAWLALSMNVRLGAACGALSDALRR